MTSQKMIDLVGIKTIFLVTVVAVPAICFIGILGYSRVQIDVTSHLRHFRVGWNAAKDWNRQNSSIHIAVVICGNRVEEGLVMLKSAVIFSKSYLVLHVFTEENHRQAVKEEVENWPYKQRVRLKLIIHKIEFPTIPGCKTCSKRSWAKLFRPCAAQRLFIPDLLTDVDSLIYMDTDTMLLSPAEDDLLTDVDSLIYMDTDTVFLSPVEDVWRQFSNFESQHIFGIVPEISGWYANRVVPHCTKTGVNTGVLLMNLTRTREVKWMFKIQEYFDNYRELLKLGDQDLINIYCYFYPGLFYLMQCVWNYRGGFCSSDEFCQQASSTGINILHANNKIFHDDKFPVMGQIYLAFKEHDLSQHSLQNLYDNILKKIEPFTETKCGKRQQLLTRNLQKYILNYKRSNFKK